MSPPGEAEARGARRRAIAHAADSDTFHEQTDVTEAA